jgi:hypothetical protein
MPFAIKKSGIIREVASHGKDKIVVFYCLCASEIWIENDSVISCYIFFRACSKSKMQSSFVIAVFVLILFHLLSRKPNLEKKIKIILS